MKPTNALTAASLSLLMLLALTVSAQTAPPPPPPPPPSGSVGSQSVMDFGSDGSGLGSGDDANDGSSWTPTPTTTGGFGSWSNDWTWSSTHAPSSSSSSSSSSSGSGRADDDDEAGIEVMFPGRDGSIDAITWRTAHFEKYFGFRVDTTDVRTGVQPGNCPYAYCVHLVFESDYGAMTPFDAFVLDRCEMANPVGMHSNGWSWESGGPLPLVLGRMSNETHARIQTNADDVFNWNETRRTTWTLYPKYKYDYNYGYGYGNRNRTNNRNDELDVTLSLKQLYTLLPGYTARANNASDGPFYSADPTDQIVLRINAHVPSAFAGASAMLPIVVNHTGSQLVDINMTSTLLYSTGGNMYGNGGGNEIQLTFTLSRRKYGGALPWFPAKLSSDCDRCMLETPLPETFNTCLEEQMNRSSAIMEDLLSPRTNRTSFEIAPYVQTCATAIASGELTDIDTDTGTGTHTTTAMRYYDGEQWATVSPPATESTATMEARYDMLWRIDKGLRCMTESLCPVGGVELKADAQVVVLRHNHAHSNMDLYQPVQHFYLQLRVEGLSLEPQIVTTQVMSVDWSSEQIAAAVANAVPDADRLQLDIRVYKNDNQEYVRYAKAWNAQRMEEYYRALQWGQGSQGSTSSSGCVGDGSAGYPSSSSSSSSSSERDESAGFVKPQLPSLQSVPDEWYSITIYSYNVTASVHVTAVMTQEDARVYNYSYGNSLNFQVASLDLNKFEYVPPPPHVDLSWSSEPEWKTQLRRMLPTFASDDSCGKCTTAFEACLFDFDCAFGVNDYLRNALSRDRLAHKITTSESPGDPGVLYTVNITDAMHEARAFFPAQGLATFEALGMCWMANECNLDYDRTIYFDKDNEYLPAKPTTLRAHGTEIQVVAELEETVTFSCDACGTYGYMIPKDVTADAIQVFLRDTVLQNQPALQRNVSVVITDQSWWRNTVSFSLRWNEDAVPGFKVGVQRWGSSATEKPLSMAITAYRRSVVDAYGGWTALQWPRLEQWLDLFRYVPASSYPGWNDHHTNGSSDSNSSSDGNGTMPKPSVPSPPTLSGLCWPCADLLQSCIADMNCARAVQTWLPSLLPTSRNESRAHWNEEALQRDDITYGHPMLSPENQAHDYVARVLRFASCLAKQGCPVGMSNATDTMTTSSGILVPTTVRFEASIGVSLLRTTVFELKFQDLYSGKIDEYAVPVRDFLALVREKYGETIDFVYSGVNGNFVEFSFTGSYEAIQHLSIYGYPTPGSQTPRQFKVWFESPAPAQPNWDLFLMWYGVGSADPYQVACSECLPKLEACYDSHECWQYLRYYLLPVLKQETGSLNWHGASSNTSSDYTYAVDVGSALYDLSLHPVLETGFLLAWPVFADILSCYAAMACDVETMNSAMEPPATAHVPSFLKIHVASVQLFLYFASSVRIDFNGRSVEYTEMASGSTTSLVAAFENALESTSISFSVALVTSDEQARAYRYTITFSDLPRHLPQVSLVARGDVTTPSEPFASVTPWKLLVESVNQFPEWDQLVVSLANRPPPSPSVMLDTSMFQCDAAVAMRSACYRKYDCYSILTRAITAVEQYLERQWGSPVLNADTQQFEIDLTWVLDPTWFWGDPQTSTTAMMSLIRESARCAAQSLAGTNTARPIFRDMRVSFLRPMRGDLSLTFLRNTGVLRDDQTSDIDRVAALEQFVSSQVVVASNSNATVRHWYEVLENGTTKHEFEFDHVYAMQPPHLSANDPTTGGIIESVDTPWKLVFQSPTFALNDAFAPWLAWLSKSPTTGA